MRIKKYNRSGGLKTLKFQIMKKVSKKHKQSASTKPAIDGYTVLYAVLLIRN